MARTETCRLPNIWRLYRSIGRRYLGTPYLENAGQEHSAADYTPGQNMDQKPCRRLPRLRIDVQSLPGPRTSRSHCSHAVMSRHSETAFSAEAALSVGYKRDVAIAMTSKSSP